MTKKKDAKGVLFYSHPQMRMILIIFYSDMCGGKNTYRGACARAANGGDKVLLGCVRPQGVREAECALKIKGKGLLYANLSL